MSHYRRLWIERAAFILLFAALALSLYRQFVPRSAWAIVVEGEPAAIVSSRRIAEQILAAFLREQAGAFASQARFRPAVRLEEIGPGEGRVLNRWKAQEQLRQRLTVIIPACWLVVDGARFLALPSRAEAETCLHNIVQHYLPKGAQLVGEPRFREKVELLEEPLSPATAKGLLVFRPEAEKRLLAPSVPPKEYVVRRGQTASAIASRFKVSLQDLQTANPELDLNRLREGEQIVVAGGRPALTVIFRAREAKAREIPFWTEYVPTKDLAPGERKVLRQGRPGKQVMRSLVTYMNGKEVDRLSRAGEIVAEPVPARIAIGAKSRPAEE